MGGGGWAFAISKRFAPHLTDLLLRLGTFKLQKTDEPKSADAPTNLYETLGESRIEGDYSAQSRGISLVTWLETHPSLRAALANGVLVGGLALVSHKK